MAFGVCVVAVGGDCDQHGATAMDTFDAASTGVVVALIERDEDHAVVAESA